jgi:hypothetical protein
MRILPLTVLSAVATDIRGSASISSCQLIAFKTMFFLLSIIATVGLIVVGALLFAIQFFSPSSQAPAAVADGAIYLSALLLAIIITVAIIAPALLMLQPARLWHVLRAEKHAVTPRQRFRGAHFCVCPMLYLNQSRPSYIPTTI